MRLPLPDNVDLLPFSKTCFNQQQVEYTPHPQQAYVR
jgi:hypothetical protein